MRKWQRYLRTAVGLAAVAVAGMVALTLRERRPVGVAPPAASTEPGTVVESAGGRTLRVNREHEDVRIEYQRLTTYTDGTSRMFGVTVVTERAGGRTFTVTGDEGRSGQKESTLDLTGHVRVVSSDGIDIRTDAASYAEQDGTVRAPGAVSFTQGRTSGHATGFRYDKTADTLALLSDVEMHVAQGATSPEAPPGTPPAGASGQDIKIRAHSAEYRRPARTMRFDGAARAVRGSQVVEGETLTALLDAAADKIEQLTVTGGGRLADTAPSPGGLQSLSGKDIDLTYQPSSSTLDRVRVVGAGRLTMAAQRGPGSEIVAESISIRMAPDGTTPMTLDASARVAVSLPPDRNTNTPLKRTVTADEMTGRGDDGKGITRARFEGNVVFSERGGATERTAHAGALDVAVSTGLGSVDDARFSRRVRFDDGALTAEAPAATYQVSQGSLSLRSGGETAAPHLKNDRISVTARELDVVLDGPGIEAKGEVKSEIRPSSRPEKGQGDQRGSGAAKMPSMLKADQPVSIAAETLSYDGRASRATYRGSAQLWQGDTTIRAAELVLDEKSGDLTGTGSVATSIGLRRARQATPPSPATASRDDAPATRTRTTATAQNLRYEEGARTATYTGRAHMTGDQGDMTAAKIELYLNPSGEELERVEAYDAVTLQDRNRRTTGNRLTYLAEGERYVVTGSPVTIVDECERETIGRTLTFDRVSDKLVVDGSERARTRTKGRSNCQ